MFNFFKSSYQKIKKALTKTRSLLSEKISHLLGKPIDEDTFEELERIFFEADLGSTLSLELADKVRKLMRKTSNFTTASIIEEIKAECKNVLSLPSRAHSSTCNSGPKVLLVVGVNGSGKTTSIAKLAKEYKNQGLDVLIAAADTFRAAAIDQLVFWADKVGVDIVKSSPGSDPSAVVFDALTAAKARHKDIVIIDTAGRLHNKLDLMKELEKIKRVGAKVVDNSPHEVYLVLDATTGQNAIDQAKTFNSFTPLSGLILTKLDGSAKGGIILSIYKELGIPVKWIGVGEKEDDLMPFDIDEYLEALFDLS